MYIFINIVMDQNSFNLPKFPFETYKNSVIDINRKQTFSQLLSSTPLQKIQMKNNVLITFLLAQFQFEL